MRKIMTVDDSPIVLKMVQRTLRELAFEPVTATNGREGLERFFEHDIDLLITDLNMPIMGGIELIRAIRRTNATVPILVLTTESDETLAKEAIVAGANGWLEKPPTVRALRENIARLVPTSVNREVAAYPII